MTEPRDVIDDKFGDEPSDVHPAPSRPFEDPPELTKRLVSALGGEMSDEALTPGEFRAFRIETIDILKRLADGQDTINKQLLPLVVDHGQRLVRLETRADKTDDRITTIEKKPDRVAPLELQLADVVVRVKKLETAAAKRLKGKR